MKVSSSSLCHPFVGRGGTLLLVVAIVIVGTFCRGGELIDGALLIVTPQEVNDSATVGDTEPRVAILHVANGGSGVLRWQASLKHAVGWLSFQPDSGIAGIVDSIVVQANPTGLFSGVYRDTLLVYDPAHAAVVDVPIELRVKP